MSNAESILRSKKGVCPHCHMAAHFAVMMEHDLWIETAESTERTQHISAMNCRGCGKESLITWESVPDAWDQHRDGANYAILLPREAPKELSGLVPAPVCSLFREASIAESAGALRAAAVMYRATVEAIVNQRNATGKDLYAKIEHLDVPEDLRRDFHEARMLGNDSIHAGIEYDRDEVEDIAALITEACHILYVQPEERRLMRERRKERRETHKAQAKAPAGETA